MTLISKQSDRTSFGVRQLITNLILEKPRLFAVQLTIYAEVWSQGTGCIQFTRQLVPSSTFSSVGWISCAHYKIFFDAKKDAIVVILGFRELVGCTCSG